MRRAVCPHKSDNTSAQASPRRRSRFRGPPPWAYKYNYTRLTQAQYFSDRAESDADSTDTLLRRTDLRILLLIILAILCSKRASFSSFIKPTIIMQAAMISITVNANPIFPSDEHLFVIFILLSFLPFVNTFFKKTLVRLTLTGSKTHPFDHNGSCIHPSFLHRSCPLLFDPVFTIQHL